MRIALALALVLAQIPLPAEAAPLRALPATIRVNIAGLGTSYAQIGSTGAHEVRRPEGTVVYAGRATTVARRDTWRVEGAPALPPAGGDDEARMDRRRALLERRAALREGSATLVYVPFELAVLRSLADDVGRQSLAADRVVPLRFVATEGVLTYAGKPYRGTLELALDDAGDMIVVNEVPTAQYLASVVGAEVPETWEDEALAAQAIAARTYLAKNLRRHRAYDLEGDVRDQAYGGIVTETDSTSRAVRRTAGIVATYRGAAIEALYSANAGGVTEDSENVYQNALPYLRSVPSPADEIAAASSWGRTSWEWTRELTVPQLRDELARRGLDVGTPERIELTRLSAAGRVLSARVIGTRGARDIGKDQSRYYFGLRSALFAVERVPGGELEVVGLLEIERRRALEGLGSERVGEVYRRTAGDFLQSVGGVYQVPDRFVFKGRGFGHGVGMSQWGAQGMALGGASAEEILIHYYRGIALTNVGGD